MSAAPAAHRQPPKPPWFDSAPFGICRWCNLPILNPDGSPANRRHWHKGCVANFNCVFEFNRARARELLKAYSEDRGGYVCACCGGLSACEVDHFIPLAEALPHADDALWQWRPANLQVLCSPCHAAKTAAQAARWARWRASRRAAETLQSLLFGGKS